MITQAQVIDCFEYRDGNLYWKRVAHPNKQYLASKPAGSIHKTGYRHVTWMGKIHKAHRLIFLMHHGYLPEIIDHINGNKLDNRIENLREATVQQNNMNAKTKVTNKSGVKGVSWHPLGKKWMVRIMINGKDKYFGMYEDLEFAALVAQEARNKYHGAFARHA